ncbi:CLERC [Mytilus edulis]|uniref:Leucine-rich repeat and coiled-coil domain-containing protein 1 n=1 Tax=Mytilus edulis TaxID=6550 RepID=A0A8S3V032_MYTED|nr:CLERC [Mytilus edulis]
MFRSDLTYRGLAGLRSLVKLNLSHNQIEDASGFKSIHGSDYRLTHLELHGNKLVSRKHVIQCLSGCVNLRQLTLDVDSTPNPLCNHSEYRQEILTGLSQIQSLDNVGRDGISSEKKEVLADIPGLEEYIDYLLSNGNSIASESSQSGGLDVITPKIDQALQYFKQRGITTSSDTSSVYQSEPELDRSLPKQKKVFRQDILTTIDIFNPVSMEMVNSGNKLCPLSQYRTSETDMEGVGFWSFINDSGLEVAVYTLSVATNNQSIKILDLHPNTILILQLQES